MGSDYCHVHGIRYNEHENCPECQKHWDKINENAYRMKREFEKRKTMPGHCSFCGTPLNSKGDCSSCDEEFGPNFR